MNQITRESVKAFLNAKKFKKSNTSVEVLPNVTILKYHQNAIAFKYNDTKKTLKITNCGWFSRTTKERLDGLPGVDIVQRNFVWYLNGKAWNGDLIDIK